MYFNKCHQPENFVFAIDKEAKPGRFAIGDASFNYQWKHLGENVHRLAVQAKRWPKQYSQAELSLDFDGQEASTGSFSMPAGLSLDNPRGKALLSSKSKQTFGVSGQSWMMQFTYDSSYRFYGLGEKAIGFEHSGKHTKFWNTDVWADFDGNAVCNGRPDPLYLAIPYLIVKRGNDYVGILVNNPHAVFMSFNPRVRIAQQADASDGKEETRFFIGAPDGQPEVFFIVGPTLAELTRKLQRLVGKTPRPPLWSLGHQQCRWGYAGYKDLNNLDQNFRKHKIPNDGLWVDIDYMRGYRVFTWNEKHWPKLEKQIADIQSRGQHVVPILDPGVKVDKGFSVYKSGKKQDIFCHNPAGTDFVGFVWPGTTVFPDFSLEEARKWWANWVKREVGQPGVEGAWLDMNDPATGLSENSEMLFNRGKDKHDTYHNQYALGMAKASFDGFLQAYPNQRPFLLTRSGFISTNRYAAAWTGDNYSNAHHLTNAIPTTLNLALSGLPFNGPDVPGFGDDATPELATDWYKTCFLFPVLRNHANKGTRDQEPWAFGNATMKTIRHFIRLRYKFLPYLYNLFIQQEQTGEAILRPLMYDFADRKALPLEKVDDQFLIGSAVMQAPFTNPETKQRSVVLPKSRWYDVSAGKWVAGDRVIKRQRNESTDPNETPLYIRDGSVIPMRPGTPTDNATDLHNIELHLFIDKGNTSKIQYTYQADDGKSYDYRKGDESKYQFTIASKGKSVTVKVESNEGAKPLKVCFVTYATTQEVVVHSNREDAVSEATLESKPTTWKMTDHDLAVGRTKAIRV